MIRTTHFFIALYAPPANSAIQAGRRKFFFGLFLLVTALSWARSAHAVDLVREGKPLGEIVLAGDTTRMPKLAARELQTYIEKISGAKLPIVETPTPGVPARVYVGKSKFTDEQGLKTDDLKHGAFLMASGSDWLSLLGPDKDYVPIEPWGRKEGGAEKARINAEWDKVTGDKFANSFSDVYTRHHPELGVWQFDDTGTINAVYEFLRGLGVRWYAPGELGEVVPRQSTIPLPDINKTIAPDFAMRRFSYYWEDEGLGDKAIWGFRLGLNPGHEIIGITQSGHGMKFVTMRDEMKAAHPEIYAIWSGKRATDHKDAGAVTLTSPLLMEKHLKYVRAVFDHFKEPAISLDPVDGIGQAISENDAELATPQRGIYGAMSDYVWGYIDQVARELHRSHPDRAVTGSAYSAYQLPPEKIAQFSPNLAIAEARWRSNFHDKEVRAYHRKLREDWLAKLPSKKYFLRDYYLHNRPGQAGRPIFFPRLIAADLREVNGTVLGENIEVYQHPPHRPEEHSYDEFAIDHLNLYVTSRLWWDAGQDIDAILDDYYSGYYGPAREQMKEFIEFSEANWMKMNQDPGTIAKALELIGKASRAADPDSVYGKRIKRIADYLQPLEKLKEQLGRKRDNALSYRILLTDHTIRRSMKEKPLDAKLVEDFYPVENRLAEFNKQLDGTTLASNPTRFQIFRERGMLYIGIRCSEKDMANLNVPTAKSGDPQILEGDHVTLLVETSSNSYYEISVNPAGTVFERDHGNKEQGGKWRSGAAAAVHKGKDFWNVEIALPIAGEGAKVLNPLHGMDGARPSEFYPWYFNVGRQRVRDATVERSAFSPTSADRFHVPEKFAHLWGK